MLSQLALAAEERPWLWVVYVLTVGLPIGLAVLFCWPKVILESWILEYSILILLHVSTHIYMLSPEQALVFKATYK